MKWVSSDALQPEVFIKILTQNYFTTHPLLGVGIKVIQRCRGQPAKALLKFELLGVPRLEASLSLEEHSFSVDYRIRLRGDCRHLDYSDSLKVTKLAGACTRYTIMRY